MAVSFQTTRKQEQKDRELLVKGTTELHLFNREHGYNYLVSLLVGRAPKNLDRVSYPQGATSYLCTMTNDKNGSPVRLGRNELSHGAKRDPRKHTRKSNKGSSSSSQSKRYALHLVEDVLQASFLYYWENRNTRTWLTQGDKETRNEASSRITRLVCRHTLLNHFQRIGVERRALKLISSRAFALLKNNDDMLSAETLCDDLAAMLAEGNAKQARIIRATMAKTSKMKCLARAMRCHRNTVNNRLAAISLESDLAETSSKIGTLATPPCPMAEQTPIPPIAALPPVKVFHPINVKLPLPGEQPPLTQETLTQLEKESRNRAAFVNEQRQAIFIPPSPTGKEPTFSNLCNEDECERVRAAYLNAIWSYRAKHFEWKRPGRPM